MPSSNTPVTQVISRGLSKAFMANAVSRWTITLAIISEEAQEWMLRTSAPAGHMFGDELHRGVRVADRRLVVEQQHQAGDDLHHEEEQRQPAHVVGPGQAMHRHFLLLHHRGVVQSSRPGTARRGKPRCLRGSP